MPRWLDSRPARWIAVAVWMAAIFALSAQSTLPSLTPGQPDLQEIAGHLGEYAMLGFLLQRALWPAARRRAAGLAILLAVLYGISDELHQRLVPGRACELKDLMVDTIAATTAVLLATFVMIRRRPHSPLPATPGE